MVSIEQGNMRDVSYIFANLRADDRREAEAIVGDMDTEMRAMLSHQYASNPLTFVFKTDRPVMFISALPITPVGLSFASMATDRVRDVLPAVLRFCRGPYKRELLGREFRWAEARAMASNTGARRFIEAIGGGKLCDWPQYGVDGEDFVLYRWAADEV